MIADSINNSDLLRDLGKLNGEAGRLNLADAEGILTNLANVFFQAPSFSPTSKTGHGATTPAPEGHKVNVDVRYRALTEQIPAIIFMAYLDEGNGEIYVSPQIEETLGFSQSEWLEDPVRWYQQIHPGDKQRWSLEAAQMFLSGEPLKSAYRVLARDGRIIWFHCEAKMMRRSDGRPWFIHGIAFDITEQKRIEEALEEQRNVLSLILDTVGALVVVLDPAGRIIRFNRAGELVTGYAFEEVEGRYVWDLALALEDRDGFRTAFDHARTGQGTDKHESCWITKNGDRRLIVWSTTVLPKSDNTVRYVIATGIDITERKRLEGAVLEISGREQRRIGQDLHDGLGQHLTGIAFMSKVQEIKLAEKSLPEAADAAKIVSLVNEAIHKTRELARGLHPVLSDSHGIMSALQQFANEIEDLFQISCGFDSSDPVVVHDDVVANHLYRIAQEAVHNAIKHGKAKHVVIDLAEGTLAIRDDGLGMPGLPSDQSGMGLQIMRYRAGMIGGTLEIARCGDRGTLVTCRFPKQSVGSNEPEA